MNPKAEPVNIRTWHVTFTWVALTVANTALRQAVCTKLQSFGIWKSLHERT